MENVIIIVALVLILGGAALYVYKAKKRGQKCIGCPESKSGTCQGNCSACGGACWKTDSKRNG